PLSAAGIAILAVSRGGRVYYEPEPDFRIFPADILLLTGPPAGLKDAESVLNQRDMHRHAEDTDFFEIAEISVSVDSKISGRSLTDLRFRQNYGATLVGIRRGREQITTINPTERLLAGDCIIVIGKAPAIKALKDQAPL
ncbi:MAG TPA: sodium:proton exchanger, partial [Geoalkalibacter subterraneus]|nr:sodium:proton exchanger [Geoalkalibacter subterraneus]